MEKLVTLSFCFVYALFNVAGSAIIKLQLKGLKLAGLKDWFNFLLDFKVIAAFALIFLSALVMFKALSTGQFSFVIPVATGINFVLTLIVGTLVFKDTLNLVSFAGLTLILSGIFLLAFNTTHNV